MFTGLVETTGTLLSRSARGPGHRMQFRTALAPLELGESISVNGVCLTVEEITANGFAADVSRETDQCTTLGRLAAGGAVNLERSLAAGARLGGHLVSGHVDGVARVAELETVGDAWRVALIAPASLADYLASKGSITVDGVSLTINSSLGSRFEVMLIPHTRDVTTLKHLTPGAEVNIEVDVLARYVVHYLRSREGATRVLEDT
jgi:riboflavin synthase